MKPVFAPKTLWLALVPAITLCGACATSGAASPSRPPSLSPQRSAPSEAPECIDRQMDALEFMGRAMLQNIDPGACAQPGASRVSTEAPETPEPSAEAAPSQPPSAVEASDRDAATDVPSVKRQMEEEYQAGLEAYQAGRFEEAKKRFDRAVDIVVSSEINLNDHPALKKTFDEIVRSIADMDTDATREPEQEAKDNASPLDTLPQIAPLPPEDAEKERQKIRKVAGEIEYDIPIVLNAKVLSFVEAFQTRLRPEFEAGLKRSGMYLPMIKKIFREEGLPEDLAYMAHQESAFKTSAYSRARAKGMWQFMSFTGRRYGLKRDLWVDERSDFEKATRAAAGYLKDLYARYNDWYLAMAAYNAGEGKIDRAIARARTRDYWALTKTRYIRPETKYYVPAILASILIDKSPEDYGFDVELEKELTWDTILIEQAVDLDVIATAAGTTLERMRLLNPELHGLITPPNMKSYTLRVPEGTRREVTAHLETLPADQRVSWTLHEVRSGETFSHIARKHSVPVRSLIDANPRYAGRRLRRGNVLNVPIARGSAQHALAKISEEPTYAAGQKVIHRVSRGENLQEIAWRYRTTVANLRRWNGLKGSLIRPGQRLTAYYGEKGNGPVVEPVVEPVIAPAGAPVTVSGGRIEYRVQFGDTVYSIARKFSAAVEDMYRWNQLGPDSVLQPGDLVFVGEGPSALPSPEASRGETTGGSIRHRVKRGETLLRIARLYDVTVGQVRAWNRIAGSRIYPGQVLTIREN